MEITRANTLRGHAVHTSAGRIATTSYDGFRLMDLSAKVIAHQPEEVASLYPAVVFRPDGRHVASNQGAAPRVSIRDMQGKRVAEIGAEVESVPMALDYSPDSKLIGIGFANGSVMLYDAATFRPIGVPVLAQKSPVISLCFNPQSTAFATGAESTIIRLWDIAGSPLTPPIRAHAGGVHALQFTPDGRILMSGGRDEFVRFWATGAEAWMALARERLRSRTAQPTAAGESPASASAERLGTASTTRP
ncbi:MAG TPA: hypothetical protein VF614_02740 [Chthoniobacteraceae bacterium]